MGDERGVCVNCGGDMDFSPLHPWCPDCDFAEEEFHPPWIECCDSAKATGGVYHSPTCAEATGHTSRD